MKGKLIVIEGLDGSGKNTQAKLLFEHFCQKTKNVKYMSFPDYNYPSSVLAKMYLNSEFGDKPADVNPYASASFFAVDRFASFKKNWGKNYNNGETIICDRYTTSNTMYNMAKISESEWGRYLEWLYDYEYSKLELPKPNVVIYLNMPVDVSQDLMKKRYLGDNSKKDLYEKDIEYLRICERAAKFVNGADNWVTINCLENGGIKSKQQMHEEILGAVMEKLR